MPFQHNFPRNNSWLSTFRKMVLTFETMWAVIYPNRHRLALVERSQRGYGYTLGHSIFHRVYTRGYPLGSLFSSGPIPCHDRRIGTNLIAPVCHYMLGTLRAPFL